MANTTLAVDPSEKPFGISQIRAYIPIRLDLDKMNYDVWRELFETHCLTFGVVDHLDGSAVATPATEKTWKERDGLVKMWIYGTITDSLVETILTPKSTARDLWNTLENLFRDNKENRALQLENELRTITIGDLSVQEYCRKLKSLSDLLANVDSPVTDRQLVMHCLNGHASYAGKLIGHAKDLFEFAKACPGLYQSSISNAGGFYASSGYDDELFWAAAWLHRATDDQIYLDYLNGAYGTGGQRTVFSWDDKFVGAQVLMAKLALEGKRDGSNKLDEFKGMAEDFICNCAQMGSNNFKKTPGGLLWFLPWNALQYTTTASFVLSAYSKYLKTANTPINCPSGSLQASDLLDLARAQVDYILGSNPKGMSYMVGFGTNYPKKSHHRGASIVSIKKSITAVSCNEGYSTWYNNPAPNPNVLTGALVGGPDENDAYGDERTNFQQSEPVIATVAPFVGVLAAVA